jgi:hypothetical protein
MNEIVLNINLLTLILFIITLLSTGVCFFLIGYFCGNRTSNGVYYTENIKNNQSYLKSNNKISIDETKFVTDIKTDNLEKKYNSLGDIKQSQENINSSINKLKNIKG